MRAKEAEAELELELEHDCAPLTKPADSEPKHSLTLQYLPVASLRSGKGWSGMTRDLQLNPGVT